MITLPDKAIRVAGDLESVTPNVFSPMPQLTGPSIESVEET